MSGNQQVNDFRFDGDDDRLLHDDQQLTIAYLQAHPVWQFMLKRFEAHQIAANGPPLHEIEICQGLGPVEYANWVKFDQKGRRIGWSQAVRRPKGEGWQPYSKPKRRSKHTGTEPVGLEPQKDQRPTSGGDNKSGSTFINPIGGTSVNLTNPTIKVGNGTASIKVLTDAAAKSSKTDRQKEHVIWIQVDAAEGVTLENVHFIQFIYRYQRDKNGAENTEEHSSTPHPDGSRVFNNLGEKYKQIDAMPSHGAYYDGLPGSERAPNRLIMFDAPGPYHDAFWPDEGIVAVTYVIVDGKPVYQIDWKLASKPVDRGWQDEYTAKGKPLTATPDDLKKDKLLAGYRSDEGGILSDPAYVENPIPKANR